MSLAYLNNYKIEQDYFFKVIKHQGETYSPLIFQDILNKSKWNTAKSRILETSLHGAFYNSGFHSFFRKDDAFKWSKTKLTKRHTPLELWEVEVKDILITGDEYNVYPTVVSNQIKLKRLLCYLSL